MRRILFFILAVTAGIRVWGQVDLPTGGSTFNLPLFNWQDNKSRLNFSVALNYHSGSGLKVNEIASNVGQGWNLLAGGVITRLQAGEPDDQVPRNGPVEDVTKYPAGYLYDTTDITLGCPTELTRYPIFSDENHVYKQNLPTAQDQELDHFSFEFNGRSGIFVLDKSSNTGMLLGDSRLSIWFTQDPTGQQQTADARTAINAFYIQDENGLIYMFSQVEYAKVLKTKFCNRDGGAETQPDFKNGNGYYEASFDDNDPSNPLTIPLVHPWVASSWYLTSITDPLTGNVVSFNYNPTPLTITNNEGVSFSFNSSIGYTITSHATSITRTPQLTSITTLDGHEVDFNYGQMRADDPGDQVLSNVTVKYNNNLLSEYVLTTSYFIRNRYGTPVSPDEVASARLCLQSVQHIGPYGRGSEPPYRFDYYLGSSATYDFVPPPFYYMKDIWGYYNGAMSVDAQGGTNASPIPPNTSVWDLTPQQVKGLCYVNDIDQENDPSYIPRFYNVNSGYAKNGLLKSISYPSGGVLTYTYAQNQGTVPGQSYMNVGGVHVTQTSMSDGGFSNGCTNPLTTTYNYTADFTNAQSSMYIEEAPVSWLVAQNNYNPESKYVKYIPLFTFEDDYHFKFPGILALDQATSMTANEKFWVAFGEVANIVGSIMDVVDVLNLCLDASGNPEIAVALDVAAAEYGFALSAIISSSKQVTEKIFYSSDLNSVNPLPIGYKRVQVVTGDGGSGNTVYQYTNPDETDVSGNVKFPIWQPTNPTFAMWQRYGPWEYGLPEVVTECDPQNNTVKQTINNYTPYSYEYATDDKDNFGQPLEQSNKCMVTLSLSERNDVWSDPNTYGNLNYYSVGPQVSLSPTTGVMSVQIYYYYSGRMILNSTTENTYKQGDQSNFQSTVSSFSYDFYNYLPNQITKILSNGDEIITNMTYTIDYAVNGNGGILTTMVNNQMVNDLVSTAHDYVSRSNPSDQGGLLDEKVIEYGTLANGAIKPYRTLEQRFSAPTISYQTYNGPVIDNIPYIQTSLMHYDANSNLTGVIDEGGRTVTNIYDYNDKYIVASVINADAVLDMPAYASFESGNTNGGWTINGGTTQNGAAITGSGYLAMSSGNTVAAPLNITKAYVVSFWSTSSSVNVSGGSVTKLGPTINGYTYYEYLLPAGATVATISGTGNIDELRLYPQGAKMRTTTYDPLMGKTSDCDENNRVTSYTHDDIGRLRFVEDEYGNVAKMYEYSYANSNQSSCLVTYTNNLITEYFTDQNCGSGYAGIPMAYTIPAGKYSSTISQAAADQQAQFELNSLGQSTANSQSQAAGCALLYYNTAISQTFRDQNCPEGYAGLSYTYSVPAGEYSSPNANSAQQMATDDLNANGQAWANEQSGGCVLDTTSDWQWTGTQACQPNGQMALQFENMNPNSPGYTQLIMVDTGANASCPITVYAKMTETDPTPWTGTGSFGESVNVVVSFYSDAACTQALSVTNLTVNWSITTTENHGTPFTSNKTTPNVSGTSVTLGNFNISETQTGSGGFGSNPESFVYTYNLIAGAYTIEN